MATRRDPELACGVLRELLARLSNLSITHVMMPAHHMPPQDRADFLSDCAAARRHLAFALAVQLSQWEELPRVLCSIIHHGVERARAGGSSGIVPI